MKTKLTFLSIAIAALLGVGMLMAFKTEDKPKQYLIVSLSFDRMSIVDENGVLSKKKIKKNFHDDEGLTDLTKELNRISKSGYTLNSTLVLNQDDLQYIFEKQ